MADVDYVVAYDWGRGRWAAFRRNNSGFLVVDGSHLNAIYLLPGSYQVVIR
jgi:hypothetical protein